MGWVSFFLHPNSVAQNHKVKHDSRSHSLVFAGYKSCNILGAHPDLQPGGESSLPPRAVGGCVFAILGAIIVKVLLPAATEGRPPARPWPAWEAAQAPPVPAFDAGSPPGQEHPDCKVDGWAGLGRPGC